MEYFQYSTTPELLGPIWSDFDPQSKHSQLLIKAKQENDENYWTHMRKVFDHDCDTLPMDRFKVWMSVFQVPLMSNSKHSSYIRDALNASPIVQNILEEPFIGCNQKDFDMFFRVFGDNQMSMNRMQHYGHLSAFKFNPKKYSSIIELGAGVGEMADIVMQLGFNGSYTIYDFAEVSRIQKYLHEQRGYSNITYTSDYRDITPHDLCIATWSFTEMPFELRYKIRDLLKDGTRDYLIAYSNQIFGYDNKQWMNTEFIAQFDVNKYEIDLIDIPWMPWDGGTSYLFIKSKD
jgi:hypothetical protein